VILLQLNLTKLKLEVLKSNFYRKKKDMNTNKLALNWQNVTQVQLQLKFVFIVRSIQGHNQGGLKESASHQSNVTSHC